MTAGDRVCSVTMVLARSMVMEHGLRLLKMLFLGPDESNSIIIIPILRQLTSLSVPFQLSEDTHLP